MIKVKLRINSIEGKTLTELEAELEKGEHGYTSEERELFVSITDIISTASKSLGVTAFVAVAPSGERDELAPKSVLIEKKHHD